MPLFLNKMSNMPVNFYMSTFITSQDYTDSTGKHIFNMLGKAAHFNQMCIRLHYQS
jgi:hypothetical protein